MINNCDIKITDWIQAIGSIFAITGVIWGFIKLFRRDIDKEKQIASLVKIAEQSENNALQLSYQLRELVKQNEIFERQVDLLSKMLHLNQKSLELEQQKDNLSEQRRILSIKPNFIHSTTMRVPDKIEVQLMNEGGSAVFKEMRPLENNSLNITTLAQAGEIFKKSSQFPFVLSPLSGLTVFNCYCQIMLIYSDSEQRDYYQLIEGASDMIKIHPPENYEK